jgi:hypothetical protein
MSFYLFLSNRKSYLFQKLTNQTIEGESESTLKEDVKKELDAKWNELSAQERQNLSDEYEQVSVRILSDFFSSRTFSS